MLACVHTGTQRQISASAAISAGSACRGLLAACSASPAAAGGEGAKMISRTRRQAARSCRLAEIAADRQYMQECSLLQHLLGEHSLCSGGSAGTGERSSS